MSSRRGRINGVNPPALRPLGVGEILDVGIKIYWRHAVTLFKIVVFVVLPAQIVVNVVQISAAPSDTNVFGGGGLFGPAFGPNGDVSTMTNSEAVTFAVGVGVALLINALAGKLAQGACFRAVADAYLGDPISSRSSLRYALRRMPALVGVSILGTLLASLGLIFCIVPGVYLWVAFFVAVPALLVEGVGPIKALGRSRRLVKGRWWPMCGVALVGYFLVFLVSGVVSGLVLGVAAVGSRGTVVGFVLATLSTTVGSMLTTPAVAAFATVAYIDLRVRHEGFDLLLLAQRIGGDGPTVAPTSVFLPPAPAVYTTGGEQPPYWPPPPGWQPSSEPPALEPPPEEENPPAEPPYWPPPPDRKPGR
jgi:hypothetical protein